MMQFLRLTNSMYVRRFPLLGGDDLDVVGRPLAQAAIDWGRGCSCSRRSGLSTAHPLLRSSAFEHRARRPRRSISSSPHYLLSPACGAKVGVRGGPTEKDRGWRRRTRRLPSRPAVLHRPVPSSDSRRVLILHPRSFSVGPPRAPTFAP